MPFRLLYNHLINIQVRRDHVVAMNTYMSKSQQLRQEVPGMECLEAQIVQSKWPLCFGLPLFNLEHTINFEAVMVLSDYHTHNFPQRLIQHYT